MNNKVVFAAAGNGKTYSICSMAKEALINNKNKYVLLVSYTNEGIHALEKEYKKQNCGVIDYRVIIKSWYSIILSEFIRPYQCLLNLKEKKYKEEYPFKFPENFIKSIAFYEKEAPIRVFNQTHVQYFINKNKDIYSDKTSHLAYLCNEHSMLRVINRMEQIYSHIFIDELQDYAGWDLEIIYLLFKSKIQVYCVGDYKQATYRTNDSPKHRQYRDENIRNFFIQLEKEQICNISYSNTTKRFNNEICDFINTIHMDKDSMVLPESDNRQKEQVDNIGVYLVDTKYLSQYCQHYHPIILRYAKNTKISFQHECEVFNYGASKGGTYDRTVIIPVSTILSFILKQERIVSNRNRAKFYVACTRARHSIVFAINDPKKNEIFKPAKIKLGNISIPVLKYECCK